MSLWNIIRDFFVINIFGGSTTDGTLYNNNIIGYMTCYFDGAYDDSYTASTHDLQFVLSNTPDGFSYTFSFGDWLSTTATIITLCLFIFILFLFGKWLFKVVSGLFLLRN